jgi:hypothetical protein
MATAGINWATNGEEKNVLLMNVSARRENACRRKPRNTANPVVPPFAHRREIPAP